MLWEFVVFCFPDSAIVLQSDGVGDSTPVKENFSLSTTLAKTSSTGCIIKPVCGQFDDLSSGENSLEKIHEEETDNNSNKLEKDDSGIADEIDSETSSTYCFSDGEAKFISMIEADKGEGVENVMEEKSEAEKKLSEEKDKKDNEQKMKRERQERRQREN